MLYVHYLPVIAMLPFMKAKIKVCIARFFYFLPKKDKFFQKKKGIMRNK